MLCTECFYARKTKVSTTVGKFLCMFTGELFESGQDAGNCPGAVKGVWIETKEKSFRKEKTLWGKRV